MLMVMAHTKHGTIEIFELHTPNDSLFSSASKLRMKELTMHSTFNYDSLELFELDFVHFEHNNATITKYNIEIDDPTISAANDYE